MDVRLRTVFPPTRANEPTEWRATSTLALYASSVARSARSFPKHPRKPRLKAGPTDLKPAFAGAEVRASAVRVPASRFGASTFARVNGSRFVGQMSVIRGECCRRQPEICRHGLQAVHAQVIRIEPAKRATGTITAAQEQPTRGRRRCGGVVRRAGRSSAFRRA